MQEERMGKTKSYSKEFKLSAAKLVTDLGYSYKEAASQLGCSSWSIRQWVIKLREIGELPPVNETATSAQELKKLRDENAQLRIENEILKKAAAYFAKQSL